MILSRILPASAAALGLALALVVLSAPARAQVAITDVTSPGGITAWLVEEPSIPFVAMDIRFTGGAALDPDGQKGVTSLMVSLLGEGAADRDARAFAKATEELATGFGYSLSDDTITVTARFLSENRDDALALLRDSLVAPRFDPEAIERVRAQTLASLRSDARNPRRIAGKAFDAKVFGDHPYGQPRDGTEASVTALTRADIAAAHRGALTRDGLHLGVVGDITADELGPLLDALFADLPETGWPAPGPVAATFDGTVTTVDFPTPQSVLLFGQPGIDRDHPDFFAAFVLNTVLGASGFESRLMRELRERRGLTYGVTTYLANRDQADLLQGMVATSNDRVPETLDVLRAEWARLARDGITEEELTNAQTYLTGAYPLRFDGNARIAAILAGMQRDGMPIDYVNTRNAMIEAVTLQDVNRVAAGLLDPSALSFVIVGQPEGIEPPAAGN